MQTQKPNIVKWVAALSVVLSIVLSLIGFYGAVVGGFSSSSIPIIFFSIPIWIIAIISLVSSIVILKGKRWARMFLLIVSIVVTICTFYLFIRTFFDPIATAIFIFPLLNLTFLIKCFKPDYKEFFV